MIRIAKTGLIGHYDAWSVFIGIVCVASFKQHNDAMFYMLDMLI